MQRALHAAPEYARAEVLKSQIGTALGLRPLGDGELVGVIKLTCLVSSPSPRGGRWATSADSQRRFPWFSDLRAEELPQIQAAFALSRQSRRENG
jgi:hypothetical protein